MLASIRERAQGWIAWTIIGLIIFVFAIWGIHNFFGNEGTVSVLTVDGTEVSLREYQQAYQQHRDRLQGLLGGNLEKSGLSDDWMKRQVIDSLIQDIVFNNAIQNMGMRIGDYYLGAEIHNIDAFRVNGRFSKDRYEQSLRNQGITPGIFEKRVRSVLLTNQLKDGISKTAAATPGQVDHYLRLNGQEREIAYLTIPRDRFHDAIKITEDDLQRFFSSHQERYQVEEQVTISYLELSIDNLMEKINPTDQELQAFFQENKANYHKEEQRQASHILLTLDSKATPETVAAVRKKAEDLRNQLINGANFEELAKLHSQDPGSAQQGGDLGFFGRGAMVKPFEEASFVMKEGQISDLVQSDFGIHIIKLTAIDPARDQTFTEARAALSQEFRRTKAEPTFFESSEILANLTYEHPDSLEFAAERLGLVIKKLGPFTRTNGTGLAANPKVITAAFSDEVIQRGNNSDPLELGKNDLLVLRLQEHQQARAQTFPEVKETLSQQFRQQRAQELAKEEGERLLVALRNGGDSAHLATQDQLSWQRPGWVSRRGNSLPEGLASSAFRLPHPIDGKPVYAGQVMASGDYAVLQCTGLREGDPKAADEARRSEAARQLSSANAEQDFATLLAILREKAKVTMRPLDRL